MRKAPNHDLRRGYRLRLLSSLAASLIAVLAVLHLGPSLPADSKVTYSSSGQEQLRLKDVQPTRQGQATPPPPPVPLPPVVRPDAETLDPFELDVQRNLLALNEPPSDPKPKGPSAAGAPAKQVAVAARPVRIVEPEYTAQARGKNVRASVTVKVLVDKRGNVQEATITERRILNAERETKRRVPRLGYGLEHAALTAARRWQFRPARQNGKAVRSYTTITLNFGI